MTEIERVARAICTAAMQEPGFCGNDDPDENAVCVRSCVGCRNVARAAIEAMREAPHNAKSAEQA